MARFSAVLLSVSLLLPAGAFAQEEAEVYAPDVNETPTFAKRGFYAVSPNVAYVNIPNVLLDGFFSRHTGMWEGDAINLSYGLSWSYSRPDAYEISATVQQTSMATADGYWLEKGDRVEEADWTTNNLSMLSVETQFHWLTGLSGDGRTQLAYGFGLGVAKVSGSFKKYDLDPGRCGVDGLLNAERLSTDASLLDQCFTPEGDPAWLLDDDRNPKVVVEDKIPPVVPVLSASIGLRQEISENAVLGLDMGIRAPQGLFVGRSAGFQWPQGE
jgi:hypothetical protein